MDLKLKLSIVENKRNKQLSLCLPKKKIPEELLKKIKKNKYIKLRLIK